MSDPETTSGTTPDPGDSTTRRGEDVGDQEGKEAGRKDAGTKGQSDRPVGTSTSRDSTGVGAQEPIDDDSPGGQGGQGG